jgi:hypothetical protein
MQELRVRFLKFQKKMGNRITRYFGDTDLLLFGQLTSCDLVPIITELLERRTIFPTLISLLMLLANYVLFPAQSG